MKNAPQGTIGAPLLSHVSDCKLACYCVLSKLVDLCLEINSITYKTSFSLPPTNGVANIMFSVVSVSLSVHRRFPEQGPDHAPLAP